MSRKISEIVNEYCEISTRMKEDKKRMEELRKLLLPNLTVIAPLKTNRWCITYSVSDVESLDTKRIRDEMTAEWIKEFTVKSQRETLKVTKLC